MINLLKKYIIITAYLFGATIVWDAQAAYAQIIDTTDTKNAEPSKSVLIDIMPAHTQSPNDMGRIQDAHTHPPVRLTPDKSEIINFERPASSIIIGNPSHLSILADTASRIVLVPRAPGASYFTVLDENGDVIMQRHAIIASPKKEYVRIRRTCSGNSQENCQETSVFYCPDMCHEIMIGNEDSLANGTGQQTEAIPRQGSSQTGDVDQAPPPPENFNEPAR